MRRLWNAVALVLIIFGATTSATAAVPEPRVALVIGNSSYDFAPLKNPVNDAHLMAETLRGLGFQVIERTDVGQRGMRRLIRDFGEALDDAGPESVGLFYYAGHGVQARGENYLIPTGAEIRRESDLKIEGVSANEVLNTLSYADNRLNIVIPPFFLPAKTYLDREHPRNSRLRFAPGFAPLVPELDPGALD